MASAWLASTRAVVTHTGSWHFVSSYSVLDPVDSGMSFHLWADKLSLCNLPLQPTQPPTLGEMFEYQPIELERIQILDLIGVQSG